MNEFRVRRLEEGPFRSAVLEVVSQIPRGRVARIGDIAGSIGYPRGAARLVEWVVASDETGELPKHRVVRSNGGLIGSGRRDRLAHAAALESENVEILPDLKVDAGRYGWRPSRGLRSGPANSRR